ncbi:MAG TPA: sugar transferase [Terriglobales bacterium]|nr:sugar transferase [Terriglobales bacterium]
MIKVLNQYFPRRWAVLLLSESLLILLALTTAVALDSQYSPSAAPLLQVLPKVVLITLICQVCLHYGDLYAPEGHSTASEVVARMLQALGLASLVLAMVYWLLPQVRLSTSLVVGSVIAILLLLVGWRRAMDAALRWAQRAYPSAERVLVLGAGERARALVHELRQHPYLGLELVGMVAEDGSSAIEESDARAGVPGIPGIPVLGELADVTGVIARHRPSRIVLALEDRSRALPAQPLMGAWAAGICIEEGPTLFERVTGRIPLDHIRPSWLFLSDSFYKSGRMRFYKRASSAVTALLGLIVLSPALLLAAIAIKLDSPGPVIYRQQRVGLHGRPFDIFKFRSMRTDAERSTGPVWAQAQDPRITRVGRWLRKLRVDELPQLFNVLQGTMNIVGPRPERPRFVEEFRRDIPYYELRHGVAPGITGWAQVSRDYGASIEDAREKLEYDLFYIKNLSIWLDLFILFQTTKIVVLGRGAR